MFAERINEQDNDYFEIALNGEKTKFFCNRETLDNGRRGNWILYENTPMGQIRHDRDQYSNDILERVQIHLNERPIYGKRIRIEGVSDQAYFDENVADWLEDIKQIFGGEWVAEWEAWSKCALFERV
jgi:hypothetical protein